MRKILRNRWISTGFVKIVILLSLLSGNLKAQPIMPEIQDWNQFKGAQYFLYNHLAEQAYVMLDVRTSRINKLNSLTDWQQRQEWVKRKLLDIVGPFPEKKPLNARVTKTIKKDGYRVEHIIFESQPGFFVSSSLYIPVMPEGDMAPAVIYCSGHSEFGYRSTTYQHIILNLVKKGFIVYAFDPVGQGERIQYYDPGTKKSTIGVPTREHSYPGAQVLIAGGSVARYMIWDGIRALDYLVARKEVDPARIGITGRSGGGTLSAYIAALDTRIYATAPECWLTNNKRQLQSKGPQDAEQNLYHAIYEGIDHPDYLIVRAPKPALMITTTNDIFSIQGARETEKEVSRIYQAYGLPQNFGRAEDFGRHESTKNNRESMYAFFQKHLKNPGNPVDEEVEQLTEEDLVITPSGQFATFNGSETLFSLNRIEAEKLKSKLEKSRSDLDIHLANVVGSAKKLSGYLDPLETVEPILTGSVRMEGFTIEEHYIKGEGDYIIPYTQYVPEKFNHKALIYLHPSGRSTDSTSVQEIDWFVKKGYTVLVPDLLGTGVTYPEDYRGDAYIGGVAQNIWYASILINRSIVGIRAGDVNRLSKVLENDPRINEISALAKGSMSPVLLHAAVFNSLITNIALIEPYSSYLSITMNRFYDPGFIYNSVAGAIEKYDLPDLAACLAPRKLLIIDVTDGTGDGMERADINESFNVIQAAYKLKNAENYFKVAQRSPKEDFGGLMEGWLMNR